MSSLGPLKNDHKKSCENETNNSFDDGRTEGESVIISSNMLSAHSSASKLNDTDESLLIRSDIIGGLPELRVNSNSNRFGEGNKEGECKKPNNLVRTFSF